MSKEKLEAYDAWKNRPDFSYDVNGDALYQQYKDQYITQGKLAMQDTMGQAAAMTGGYGNSYAQNVGQQAYQGYLQQLNDKVPELYQLALDQYNQEGENLLNQYGLLSDREKTEYGRYRDTVTDAYEERDYLTGRADTAYEQGYQAHYDKQSATQEQENANRSFQLAVDEFNKSVDEFEKEYDIKLREITEQEKNGAISREAAQKEMEMAEKELEAKYITAGFTKDKNGNWVAPAKSSSSGSTKDTSFYLSDDQEARFYSFIDNEDWAGADNYIAYLRSLPNGLSEEAAQALLSSIPASYWNRQKEVEEIKPKFSLYTYNPYSKTTDYLN